MTFPSTGAAERLRVGLRAGTDNGRMDGYDAVMQVAAGEDPEVWLAIAAAAYDDVMRMAARFGGVPSGWSFSSGELNFKRDRGVGWLGWLGRWQRVDPELAPLREAGVLVRSEEDGYFSMPDPDGVGRALAELDVKTTLTGTRETWRKAP